jgi:hypothetical protein
MIRGHIETVTRNSIRGWIHAEGRSLRDASVLAFAGEQCIGSGPVGEFRKDLLDAGLGDGHLGFEIAIAGERVPDLASIVVKLEGSDTVLMQPGVRVSGMPRGAEKLRLGALRRHLVSYRWMLSQGWIEQADYDFLKAITTNGVYEYAAPRQQRAAATLPEVFNEIARQRLSVLLQREVVLAAAVVDSHANLLAQLAALVAGARAGERPVAALLGGAYRLRLAEGGHLAGVLGPADGASVDHDVEAHQMLFVDARSALSELELRGCDHLTLLHAAGDGDA